MNALIDLPLGTKLELAELPPVSSPIRFCDEAVQAALACSPEIREAAATMAKAHRLAITQLVSITGRE